MADLLVRGVDAEIVLALKTPAGAHGRSAEAEHRDILTNASSRPQRRNLADLLAAMNLVDTNVVSEARKRARANPGVSKFFA